MEKMLFDDDENLTDSLVRAMFKEGDDHAKHNIRIEFIRSLNRYGSRSTKKS